MKILCKNIHFQLCSKNLTWKFVKQQRPSSSMKFPFFPFVSQQHFVFSECQPADNVCSYHIISQFIRHDIYYVFKYADLKGFIRIFEIIFIELSFMLCFCSIFCHQMNWLFMDLKSFLFLGDFMSGKFIIQVLWDE